MSTADDGFPPDNTYTPRHSWPYECAGERCAQHATTHRPKHRAEDAA